MIVFQKCACHVTEAMSLKSKVKINKFVKDYFEELIKNFRLKN